MNDDYLSYWGMSKPPFSLTPDPEMLYLSGQHSECLMRLKYAIFSHKGGALLVSDNAGNGKTSVLARLKKDLNEYYAGRVKVVFIDHPTLTPIEMIGEIAHQLGAQLHTTEKIRALNYLRDRLFALYNENIKVVVIVDEGQMLKERADLLGELRILLNFCVSDAFLLTFI
ncbi:MAG: AAA family ATPase, partial [Candidatus Latescibacteria bacterium]|nr:AAA family ATPase [Candidatus Latescibacterota bacterium]